MRYREWKLINESFAGNMTLGLSNPHNIGGPVGSTFHEMGNDILDDEIEDEELEDEEMDMDFLDDEEMDFPPDDSEEMLGDDDFLNDIDPQLADLEMDDDEAGLGPEMLGDDEMGDEMLDDEMLGDEMGDEMLDDDEMGDLDVEVGDDEELGGDYESFMDRMANYCGKYMASHMAKRSRKFMHKDDGKKKKARKHMCDDGIYSREDMTDMTSNHFGKKQESTTVRRESVGTYEETEDQFFDTLRGAAKGDHNDQGWSGLSEDMLLQLNNTPSTDTSDEPQPGEAGFAPQNRVGSIGGGYTQDDISDIETMPY